ncbi:MAG TPA: glucose 1-dehydrogenase [Candidatus Methylomirabilis sp.]|nr:glucose 1-dehydrogenase [Candidatus Methylomirabilis sp.]
MSALQPSDQGLLHDRVAIVTGSSKGIGRAIAEAFAAHGADIVVNYNTDAQGAREAASFIEGLGRKAIVVRADVSQAEQVDAMVDASLQTFGHIDILVNNAAIGYRPKAGFLQIPKDDWDRVMRVNLDSLFFCSQRVLKEMVACGQGGKIINLSSVHGLITGPRGKLSPYYLTKAAINMFTKGLAVEFAAHKINVNAIAPGAIRTPGLGKYPPDGDAAYARRVPLGGRAEATEIGGTAVYLASRLSDYMTGQVLYVDGGYTVSGTLTDWTPSD